jgi:CHAD domain-containing protein
MAKAAGKKSDGEAGVDLRAMARRILAEARAALDDGDRTTAASVHDFRKSVKRWRALLRLLGRALGESGKKLNAEAREFARALGSPRDAQAALDALDDLQEHKPKLSDATQRSIRTRLDELRTTAESAALSEELRKQALTYLDRASRAVVRWPASLDAAEISKRLTKAYRRARRAIPEQWHAAEEEELHELRRRVIAYRHQADLAGQLWPALHGLHVDEAQKLRDRLGRFQDLSVLAQLTQAKQPLAPWRARLAPAIAKRQATHVKAAARTARGLFAERPKAFRRRLPAAAKTAKPSA